MVTDNHYRWDFIGLSTDEKPTPETDQDPEPEVKSNDKVFLYVSEYGAENAQKTAAADHCRLRLRRYGADQFFLPENLHRHTAADHRGGQPRSFPSERR